MYFVHSDHLGTPTSMTDESGTTVWRSDHDPFGWKTLVIADDRQPIGFPGQYHDDETGLHYNYFRYYDSSTGRYSESDPIGLIGGMSTYSYVESNPLYWVDPYGLVRECIFRPLDDVLPLSIRFEPTENRRRIRERTWDFTLCAPLPAIGAPLPPTNLRRPRWHPRDIAFPIWKCQTTTNEYGYYEELHEATAFGIQRCYSECGKLITENIGYVRWPEYDKWVPVEGSEWSESHRSVTFPAD